MFSGGTFAPRRGGGQGSQSLEEGRGRGFGRGDRGRRGAEVSRGGYFGRSRGRGAWRGYSDQEQDEILTPRPNIKHVSSEGTDDLIVPFPSSCQIELAMQVLQQDDLDGLQSPLQIRKFVQSCLLNLSNHHSVDTSVVLYNLASQKGLAKLRHIMLHPEPPQDGRDVTSSIVTFQTVTLPLIGVLTRQSLCQTRLTCKSNRVFGLVHDLCHPFLKLRVLPFMSTLLDRDLAKMSSSESPPHPHYRAHEHRSHQHNQHQSEGTFGNMAPSHCALLAIIRLIYQLMMRFPDSISGIAPHFSDLAGLVDRCRQQSEAGNTKQILLNTTLALEMSQLAKIVQGSLHDSSGYRGEHLRITSSSPSAFTADGPGALAPHGTRNDNDHAMINKINIYPTRDEVLCSLEPFLPLNDDKEPSTHFLPPGWSRHLDVHYRLYRQDAIEPLRICIQAFVHLLERTDKRCDQDFVDPPVFRRLIKDNINLNIYRNVKFLDVSTCGFQVGLTKVSFDQPSNAKGLNYDDRKEMWERSRGRLMQGSLVCFVRRSKGRLGGDYHRHQVALAVVQERDSDGLFESEQAAHIQVSLTESASYSMIFEAAQPYSPDCEEWFMIEFPGSFFEGHRPALRTLRDSRPSVLPFGKYIAPTDEDIARSCRASAPGAIDPPVYTTMPGFEFDLSVLLENGGHCALDVRDPQSVDQAVKVLRERSSLDNSQALALVETLGREIALISGASGTGKTKVGVDLIRVLLRNKEAMNCGPILVICYTNHALDQFLEHLLDQGVTNIVRVGSQSKAARLQEYNLRSMKINRWKPEAAKRVLTESYVACVQAAESIRDLTLALKSGYFDWKHVREHLLHENPAQCSQFEDSPPSPVVWRDEMTETSHSGHLKGDVAYERWATGKDLDEKRLWNRYADKKNREEVRPKIIFGTLDENAPEIAGTPRYDLPVSDRPISLLGGDVWEMSMQERRRLIAYWRPDVIRTIEQEFERHHQVLSLEDEVKFSGHDELRRLILSGVDVIGMTTTGSAKFHALLESVAPKIILCEEAGEVVESQILTALSAATQHLILIGDHLQLRPPVQTYNLCSESSVGQRYNLNRSLFERLVTSEVNQLSVSRLTIQHRMRAEISCLIKNTQYPTLKDGGPVHLYPDIGGMVTNLFFMDHSHPEERMYPYGLQSFSNSFEVEMIETLALHLIQNGYDQPGDILVLTPYFGQLAKIRNHLENRFVVLMDGRDKERLDAGGAEGVYETHGTNSRTDVQEVQGTARNHITIRSIFNCQGEEAKVVLISLVRSETDFDDRELFGSIGFLRSPNRANVLLSRAQHGMFIIGNARVMDQPEHGIWPAVMKDLRQSGRVGQGFPIVCENHPETKRVVCSAEELQAAAPDGAIETLVSDRCETIRLDEVDLDRDPLMVPPCGHALTLSTLDDLMELGRYYEGQKDESSGSVCYVGLKELPDRPSDEVACSECTQPIGASFFRYGRSVKHTQLLHLMERLHKKQMTNNNQRFTMQDGVLIGDLGEIASLYHIPWRHQSIWKEAIKPAEDALAFFGQSLVERSVRQSSPLSQSSQRSERKNAPALSYQSPPFSPSEEELSQAIRTLSVKDSVRADEAIMLHNAGCSSLILSSVLRLAMQAMHAVGVESGWYWFVGDLIDCCQLYNLQYNKMALDRGETSTASIASKMVLEGFYRKADWMTERPLGGMGSTKDYMKAVQELEQAFRAELSEYRGDDLGGTREWALVGLEEKVMALLQGATLQHEE
ncbi:hypothetical protein BGZ89_009347 [Linnemannia elongata]|nr:hypothetical protein BGZ89_009347 [Linnemannia elongata]